MYVGNQKGDEFHRIVLQSIRDLGIKHRFKKSNSSKGSQDVRRVSSDSKVFRKPLSTLKTEYVTLKSGPVIEIPAFVAEACCHIKQSCDVEGIFRKAGSAARLREIKALIDSGKKLTQEHHVVDVSNILTLFFRELPEPLLPYNFHDLLLRCLLIKENAVEGILLTCLLFPLLHLNTLAYLMEFFKEISDHEELNKMSITNLAIIITPSLMPVEEKLAFSSGTRLNHHVRVIEYLLENTEKIGVLPNHLVDRAMSNGFLAITAEEGEHDENDSSKGKKKKKRRSGSLTRMINGLKKIVGKGSPDVSVPPITSTPDFSSPCVKSAKKRKVQESSGAFSSKKKREILQSLPQSCALANAPCTPLPAAIGELHFTPRIYSHPNPCDKSKSPCQKQKPRRFFSPKRQNEKNGVLPTVKSESKLKSRLNVGRKSTKKSKQPEAASDHKSSDVSSQSDKPQRRSLDWQWRSGPWRRKKSLSSSDTPTCSDDVATENSGSPLCSETTVFDAGVDLVDSVSSTDDTSDFVRIPKSEYEEIKNRVSAIENRISHEFGCIAADPESIPDIPLIDESDGEACIAEKVQDAYQKTLEESEKLDVTATDQLAKRLSRELKIRHSLENKVIRSPSARKIGTIRRRSRENAKLTRSRSSRENTLRSNAWHPVVKQDGSQVSSHEQLFYPRGTLRRGRPNTIFTGLRQPSPLRALVTASTESAPAYNEDFENASDKISHESNIPMEVASESTIEHVHVQENCMVLPKVNLASESSPKRCDVRRASSFNGTESKVIGEKKKFISQVDVTHTNLETPHKKIEFMTPKEDHWECAQQFFQKSQKREVPVTGRESVAKIRSQNAGMVLARMRLFDTKQDPNCTPKRLQYLKQGDEKPVQSLRIQCMQDNFRGRLLAHSTPNTSKRRQSGRICTPAKHSERASPKKIGSPRKKYQSCRSPKYSTRRQKPKPFKSPQTAEKPQHHSSNECNLKKFNSLRVTSHKSPLACKGNVTAPPGSLSLSCGKENVSTKRNVNASSSTPKGTGGHSERKSPRFLAPVHLPDNLKETIYDVCTPRIEKLHKMSMSPLKDCNRIDVNGTTQCEGNKANSTYRTPRRTPYIKKPLLMKSPAEFTRTPYFTPDRHSRCLATPLRALPNNTPLVTSHR